MSNSDDANDYEDTFLSRYKEFVGMLPSISVTTTMSSVENLMNYMRSLDIVTEENTSYIKFHKQAFNEFTQKNYSALKSINLNMKLIGRIIFPRGNAFIDIETIWANATNADKSDILQYIFGIIDKIHPGKFNIEEQVAIIISVFGEGVIDQGTAEGTDGADGVENLGEGDTVAGAAGAAGVAGTSSAAASTTKEIDINKIFGTDSKEDKFVRDITSSITKTTKGKTSLSAMTKLMNPRTIMSLIGGGKKGKPRGVNLKNVMKKLTDAMPDDVEI